jgi:hypothetical protein
MPSRGFVHSSAFDIGNMVEMDDQVGQQIWHYKGHRRIYLRRRDP